MAKINLDKEKFLPETEISTYVGNRCWELLANEIIFQAAESYRTALRMAKMLEREEEYAVELSRMAKAEYDSMEKQTALAREINNRVRVGLEHTEHALKAAINRGDESKIERLRKIAAERRVKREKAYEDLITMNSTMTYLRKFIRLIDDGNPPYLAKRIEECEQFFKLINGSILTKLDTEELMLRLFREVEDEPYDVTLKEINKSDSRKELFLMSKMREKNSDEEDEDDEEDS